MKVITLMNYLKKNRKFIVVGLAFIIWMLFFDNRNVFVQHNLNGQIRHLESEYDVYLQKLKNVKEEQRALQIDPEKFAREKYFMHKSDEEVFIFEKE